MFSELVDRAVHSAGRPDALEDLAYFANETMRDISKRNDWADDTVEAIIAVPADTRNVIWAPENYEARPFRREEFIVDGCGCEPLRVEPSRRMSDHEGPFYYRSGRSFVFAQVCDPVKIFYYAYHPWLRYYPKNGRPAVFDVEAHSWGGAVEATIAKVSNWMLERHNHVVLNGTLARFFASKQDPRQTVHYSAYEQGITHISRSESWKELAARR
jgi:hypothetical protein